MKKLLLIISIIIFTTTMFSQALLVENFEYSNGQLTSASSGANVSGGNWITNTGTGTFVQVSTGNLSYPLYSSSNIGAQITITSTTSSAEDIKRNIPAQSVDGTKLYFSFLMNVQNTTGLTATGDYFAVLYNSTGTVNGGFHARTFIRTSTNGFQLGLIANSGQTPTWTTTEYSAGTTYLVVIGYEFVAGAANNIASLWVNPSLNGVVPTADVTVISNLEPDKLDAIQFRQGNAGTPNAILDGVRVATSWEYAPLPVELTSFTASAGNGVKLNWSTATEINNKGFDIERKSANSSWTKIGYVQGKGTTTSTQYYSFSDKVQNGNYQYRLKQIDFNGTSEYSKTVEVEVNNVVTSYNLNQNYPNPFNPSTTISFSLAKSGNVSLKVYNLIGQQVKSLVSGFMEAGSHSVEFNAAGLNSGMYFYKLETESFSQVRKMTLMK